MIHFEGFIFSIQNDKFTINDKLGNEYTLNKKNFTTAINNLITDSSIKSNVDPAVKFVHNVVSKMEAHFGKNCLKSLNKASKKNAEARALFNYIVLQKLGNTNLSRNLIIQQTNKDRSGIYHYHKDLIDKVHLHDLRVYKGDYICNWFWIIKGELEGIDFSYKIRPLKHNKVFEGRIKEQFDKYRFQFLDAFRERKDYTVIKAYLNKVPKKEIVEVLTNYDPDFNEIIKTRKNGR